MTLVQAPQTVLSETLTDAASWVPVQDASLPYGTADAQLEGFFDARVLYLSPVDYARIRHGHESVNRQFHWLRWAIERRINAQVRQALERIGENES